MTNPISPSQPQLKPYLAEPLPPDTFLTLIALPIVALTIGGWIYVMKIPIDRFALSSQTYLWWI